jgi:MFS family permease
VAFILVATFPYLAPGGYRALLIGPMIEGILGGLSTITATINAYLSDVTPDGSRAAVFARLAGTMMLGFASGPVLGSLLIRWSGNMCVYLLAQRSTNRADLAACFRST